MNKIIAAILAASFGLAYAMVLPIRNPPASSASHFTVADDDDAAPPIHIHHTTTRHASAPGHRQPPRPLRHPRPSSAPQ